MSRTREAPSLLSSLRPAAMTLCVALVACGVESDPTIPVAAPAEAAMAPDPGFDARAEQESVTGSGHFRQEGQKRTFTFSATRMADGGVKGEYQLRTNAGQTFHGSAVCMRVLGDEAWIGVESARDGWSGGFRVQDNGEGAGTPDRISFVFIAFGAQAWCDQIPNFAALFDIDAGNVQVHAPAGPKPQLVFSDDFESGPRVEWSSDRLSTSPGGATFLGDFSDDAVHGVTLSLDGLPRHRELLVTFDMYVIRTMDGNDATFGLDLFTFSETGSGFAFQTTFSGFCGIQSFPLAYGEGETQGCVGASAVNSLGFEWFGEDPPVPLDVVFPVTLVIPHTGSTAELFIGAEGLQDFVDAEGDFSDESWGIDNVVVSTVR